MATKGAVKTTGAPAALGPYSQGVTAGGLVFVSGQIPLHPSTGELVGDTIESQVERVLENLRAVLEAAGSRLEAVVRTTVYLTGLTEFSRMNEVYARYFPGVPPARSTVEVAALPKGSRVEIDAIALV